MPKFRHFFNLSNVDRAAGVIKDVAIISVGAAKGHGVLCDGRTLETVLDCIKRKYTSGLKVKWNPETFTHGEGSIPGLLPLASLRIADGKLLGTLEVKKSYPSREYLFDMAEDMGDTFGLSIDFDAGTEEIGGVKYMRCTDIYAATIVDEPAANPEGLFAALPESKSSTNPPPTTPPKTMPLEASDLEKIKGMMTEAISPIATKVDGLASDVAALKSGADSDTPPPTEGMSADDIKEELAAAGVAEGDPEKTKFAKVRAYRAGLDKPLTARTATAMITKAATQAFAAAGGKPIVGAGAGTEGAGAGAAKDDPNDKRTAWEKKRDKLTEGGTMTMPQATAYAVKHFPQEFNAHRAAKTSTMAAPAAGGVK